MLYKQLTQRLLDEISTGNIKVGERLPPEEKYAQHFGVSRSTLRLAFSQLEQQGIIRRRKRGGTEVIADTPVKKYNMVSDGLLDILNIGPDTVAVLSNLRQVQAEDVEDLANHTDNANEWLALTSKRYLADEQLSFVVAHVYIPEQYSDLDLQEHDRIEAIHKIIEKRYQLQVGRVKQLVSAKPCTAATANCLGLKENDPVLACLIEVEDIDNNLLQVSRAYLNPARINVNSNVQIVN